MKKQCKVCDNIYEATAKFQKKCEACKNPPGPSSYNPSAHSSLVDHKKLMILKKKLDRMSYKKAIEEEF